MRKVLILAVAKSYILATLSVVALLALAGPAAQAQLTSFGLDKTQYTSDFLIGSVALSVVFVESNGTVDTKTEAWTEPRKVQVLSKIMTGLDWWTRQNPRSPVSFTVLSQTVSCNYEPITRPYWDESLWIPDVMSRVGFSGTRFAATRDYVNSVRNAQGTDWAFVVFVVDSLNDTNGKFADGLFAYSYLGGPYTVMTWDNNGYGITNMDAVFAHEMGHIFNALDEYAGASSSGEYSYGYYRVVNGNHVTAATANDPESIMRGGIHWGLDKWAKEMLGWKDSDGNGRDDIMDRTPSASFASVASASGDPSFSGQAKVSVAPRQNNAQGYGLTVDTIEKVEYRLGNGTWAMADPLDGRFDGASEDFRFYFTAGDLGLQSISAQDVNIRVSTHYSSAGAPPTFAAASISNAHAFPNPYRPASTPVPTGITFTGLTPGAKIQVFTPAGEPVFEKQLDSVAGTYVWSAVNDAGQQLATGVYVYLITSTDGDHKDGKIAIIR